MKKLAVAVLAVLLLCSCALAEKVGLVNPMVPVESLAELNELVGCNIVHPAVMGVTDESFFTIDCGDFLIAEYNFSVNGRSYCMRSAGIAEDISGIWIDGETAFGEGNPRIVDAEIETVVTDELMVARWFTIDGQYCMACFDITDMDMETFLSLAREMRDMTDTAMSETDLADYYASLAGAYQDKWSQRAVMTVTEGEWGGADAVVTWADDAETTETWMMTLNLMEDGLLVYEGGTHAVNGETVEEELEGWFVPTQEGALEWSGASDTACAECVFERVD